MVRLDRFELVISGNDKITGDIRFRDIIEKKLPIVVITHGFTGHKDWGFLPYFAEELAKSGFIAITYNFTTDCIDAEKDWFNNVDKFATFTISQEVNELKLLVQHLIDKTILNDQLKDFADSSKIYLIGQSLGGAVSIIFASQNQVVEKIVLLGTVGTLFRYTKRQVIEWEKNGVWHFTNTRTGQELKINYSYYKDLIENNYFLERFLERIQVPTLFIHGTEDLTVPVNEIERFIKKAKNPFVELKLIKNTGHTFGIEHPFTQSTPALEQVIVETINFLNND